MSSSALNVGKYSAGDEWSLDVYMYIRAATKSLDI